MTNKKSRPSRQQIRDLIDNLAPKSDQPSRNFPHPKRHKRSILAVHRRRQLADLRKLAKGYGR